MRAVLWDGNKQLEGNLHITDEGLSFELLDFDETDLNFELQFSSIQKIHHFNLYDFSASAVEICSKSGKRNVFVVEDSDKLIYQIKKEIAPNSVM